MSTGDPTCPIHGQALCHCTPGEKLGALMAPRLAVLLVERLTRERDEALGLLRVKGRTIEELVRLAELYRDRAGRLWALVDGAGLHEEGCATLQSMTGGCRAMGLGECDCIVAEIAEARGG